jgi:hypothetical protein
MRVLCNAVIDGNVVTVTGVGQHSGITREYVIEGEDETAMAMEGIRRFVEEHQNGEAE